MDTQNTLTKIQNTIQTYDLISEGDVVLVMLSGGGDSVALLKALASFKEEAGFEVRAFHLNHQLRSGTADEDELFARRLCSDIDVPLEVVRIDVGAYADERKLNLEDAGRQVRYEHAEKILNEYLDAQEIRRSKGKIATGHTRDDRVETFFARALFGAGAGGLGSIKVKRDRIVRPLIECDRTELREWLTAQNQTWREDESNNDTTRTRAFIRARLIPAAEELNPRFREALERSMNLVADDDALLSNMANQFARDFSDDRVVGDHLIFNMSFMRTLDRTMARRTVRAGILQMFPEASRLEASHIENIVEHMDCDGYVQDLPDGLRAEARCGTLKIAKKVDPETWSDVVLNTEGETDLGAGGILYLDEVKPEELVYDSHIANVDADVFFGSLTAGPARTGERITPLGMPEGSQLLSDVFIDAKVPKEKRPFVPVIRDAQHVVWVAGQKLADRYKITDKTTRVWQLEWVPNTERNLVENGRGNTADD